MILHNDLESRSAVDLKTVGIDNYAKHPSTKILLWAYAFDDGPIQVWEPHRHGIPDALLDGFQNPDVIKAAWNVSFERNMLWHNLRLPTPIESWTDPMVNARYLSLPGSLEKVGNILGLPAQFRKIEDGERLIKLFCEPRPPKVVLKKAVDENTLFDISPLEDAPRRAIEFNDHKTHPEDWKKFIEYCRRDVAAERVLREMMANKNVAPLPDRETKLWYLDQKINSRGFHADRRFIENSYTLATRHKDSLVEQQRRLTGLENPNSNPQMLAWAKQHNYPYNSIRKEPVSVALNDPKVILTPIGRQVLTLRKQSAKTSYTKLAAMVTALSSDDYLRDQFLFMGSARAGRWSGKQVQLHNMARPIKALEKKGALDKARELIYALDYEGIENYFAVGETKGSVIDIVTSCIRSAFVASEGQRFNVCDLNAIENRVLGWVSGERKILEVFTAGRCPYLAFACLMFNLSYETLEYEYNRGNPDAKEKRQIAKPAVLGAGYRLSGGEWGENRFGDRIKTGLWGYAENMGVVMSQELAVESVRTFREEYQKVVQAWYDYENAVLRCLASQGPQAMSPSGPQDLVYGCPLEGRAYRHLVWCDRRKRHDGSFILRIHLPSGRCLHYVNAQIVTREMTGRDGTPYTKEVMAYEGVNQITKQWELIYTHGGKLIENVVQAISRDVLADAMLAADAKGLEICGHVHDEIITESKDSPDAPGLRELKEIMSTTPEWAPGLPLGAEGFEGRYYHK